eukprot:s2763_g3.t1
MASLAKSAAKGAVAQLESAASRALEPRRLYFDTAPGLEKMLQRELEAFQLGSVALTPRAGELWLTAPESALWRATLQSRVLLGARLGVGDVFHAGYESTLSNYVAGIPWPDYLWFRAEPVGPPLKVQAEKSRLYHTDVIERGVLSGIEKRRQFFMGLKLQNKEDGNFYGRKEREAPPFPTVHVNLSQNECHVSVAATAAPHARAYELALDEGQMEQEEEMRGSPWLLEPAHAAACVMRANLFRHLEESALSGQKLCVWDPFCGKGTLLLEALGIAMGVPPASPAMMMPFQQFPEFNQMHFQEVVRSLQLTPHPDVGEMLLLGSHDEQPHLVHLANLNLQAFARSVPRPRAPSMWTQVWAPPGSKEAQDLTTLATQRLPCPTAFHSLPAASIAERIRSHRPLIITSVPYGKKADARKDQRIYKRFGQLIRSMDVRDVYCVSAREDFKRLTGLDWRAELRFSASGVWLELLRWTGREASELHFISSQPRVRKKRKEVRPKDKVPVIAETAVAAAEDAANHRKKPKRLAEATQEKVADAAASTTQKVDERCFAQKVCHFSTANMSTTIRSWAQVVLIVALLVVASCVMSPWLRTPESRFHSNDTCALTAKNQVPSPTKSQILSSHVGHLFINLSTPHSKKLPPRGEFGAVSKVQFWPPLKEASALRENICHAWTFASREPGQPLLEPSKGQPEGYTWRLWLWKVTASDIEQIKKEFAAEDQQGNRTVPLSSLVAGPQRGGRLVSGGTRSIVTQKQINHPRFTRLLAFPHSLSGKMFAMRRYAGRNATSAVLGLAAVLIGRRSVVRSRAFSAEQFLRETAPPLDGLSYKGQGGRVGIFGGSGDYTGAPYYAGMAALRTGAELVYVFTAEEAALPIKSYSPELMVTPVYSAKSIDDVDESHALAQKVKSMLNRLHALVVGCGLGKNDMVLQAALDICQAAAEQGLPVVLDADGLEVAIRWPSALQGLDRILLTPNANEFRRLCEATGIQGEGHSQLVQLCEKLDGPAVLLKGPEDLVADASGRVECCSVQGTPRRSGGYGDVLAGTLGTLLAWSRNKVVEGQLPMVAAGCAACEVVRSSCRAAFARKARAMTAPDVLDEIGPVFEELCPCGL